MVGRVKSYDTIKGYGFIEYEGRSILVHYTNILMKGFKSLRIGQTVEFEIGKYNGNDVAVNVVVKENVVSGGMIVNSSLEHDAEDKGYWCSKGEEFEKAFVEKIAPKIRENIIIHPNKKNNATYIDFMNLSCGREADLKVQNTPFFTAGSKYGYNPQYTVTFNHKDYVNYKDNYDNPIIYWWVNWQQLEWRSISVSPLYGIWKVDFNTMKEMIENEKVPLHGYQQRVGDSVNATASYLFDLRWFKKIL